MSKFSKKMKPEITAVRLAAVQEQQIANHDLANAQLKDFQLRVKNALMNDAKSPQEMLQLMYCGEEVWKLMRQHSGTITLLDASLIRHKWIERGLRYYLVDKVLLLTGVNVDSLKSYGSGGESGVPSNPPAGKRKVTNLYWDDETHEIVVEHD